MFSFLNNIPQVTKNLLLLNVVMFLLTIYFQTQNVNLNAILGAHYVNSPLFEPYQIVSYFFMHGDFWHIFLNMFSLVMLGGYLERLWGPKRYFIFYVSAAIGAFALYNGIGAYEIAELKSQLLAQGVDVKALNEVMKTGQIQIFSDPQVDAIAQAYYGKCFTPMIGASGAVFGIMVAFAILFPNTEFLIYFTFPVKAKYLVGAYLAYEIYKSVFTATGDNVAHLAHIGGAIVGAIIVLIWKKDRSQFY